MITNITPNDKLVFLIRHGECGKNINSIIEDKEHHHGPKFVSKFTTHDYDHQTTIDNSETKHHLTSNGRKQTQELSIWLHRLLKDCNRPMDLLLCSNKIRTQETSNIIRLNNPIHDESYVIIDELDEMNIKQSPDEETGLVEDSKQFFHRIDKVKQLIEDCDFNNIVVVSHSSTISAFTFSTILELNDMDNIGINLKLHPMNTSVTILLFDKSKKWHCLVFNSIEHLCNNTL